jgi:hypothetical protein
VVARVARWLSGRVGWGVAGLIVLGYLVVGLMPFRWNPPRHVVNGASRTEAGGLHVPSEGFVSAGGTPRWAEAATRLGDFKLRLVFRPLSDSGTIFAYADWDGGFLNVRAEQRGPDLVVWLRVRNPAARGARRYVARGALSTPGWREVELQVGEGEATLAVDGRTVAADPVPDRPLAGWETRPDFAVTLANDLNGTRPWLGDVATCVVEVGDTRVDYLAPEEGHIDPQYWVNLKFNIRPHLVWDADNVANFLCFIPLGFVLGCLRGERGSYLWAALFCAGLSCGVELLQFGFDRMPSFTDWIMNTTGGAVGATAARLCFIVPPAPLLRRAGRRRACAFRPNSAR